MKANPQHQKMTIAEINACRCDDCIRGNAAVGIGESLAEIEDALEWLPRQVSLCDYSTEEYRAVLRFVADFHALQSLLLKVEVDQ